jgi:hypothetical protein
MHPVRAFAAIVASFQGCFAAGTAWPDQMFVNGMTLTTVLAGLGCRCTGVTRRIALCVAALSFFSGVLQHQELLSHLVALLFFATFDYCATGRWPATAGAALVAGVVVLCIIAATGVHAPGLRFMAPQL